MKFFGIVKNISWVSLCVALIQSFGSKVHVAPMQDNEESVSNPCTLCQHMHHSVISSAVSISLWKYLWIGLLSVYDTLPDAESVPGLIQKTKRLPVNEIVHWRLGGTALSGKLSSVLVLPFTEIPCKCNWSSLESWLKSKEGSAEGRN